MKQSPYHREDACPLTALMDSIKTVTVTPLPSYVKRKLVVRGAAADEV